MFDIITNFSGGHFNPVIVLNVSSSQAKNVSYTENTGWANKKQANFKLPPLQRFFINFLQNFSVFAILTEGDRVEK